MGVNDMHAMYTGTKIVHVYVQLYLLVWVSTHSISSTNWKEEELSFTLIPKGAKITDTDMIDPFSAVYAVAGLSGAWGGIGLPCFCTSVGHRLRLCVYALNYVEHM